MSNTTNSKTISNGVIIDGRTLAKELLARVKERTEKLGRRPNLLVYVASNETPATRSYLKIKAKSADAAGCDFEETQSPTFDTTADAIIVQLPLPSDTDVVELLRALPVEKDADVLSPEAREKFEQGESGALLPPVVLAVRAILESGSVAIRGKKAVVVGAGFLVGSPVATWLTEQGALVTTLTRESEDLTASLQSADIIVSGAGSPHLIKPDMLKEDVVLIDAGTSESSGVVAGDADPACAPLCSIFTPVPGGVGPLAVAYLFDNVVTLAERATHG